MSFLQIVLVAGPVLAALLILHHLATAKSDNEAILSAYRDLRREGLHRKKAAASEGSTSSSSGSSDTVAS